MVNVTKDIYYVGVNDHQIDLFEGQYDVPNGMAYNSYVVMDDKITVFDTVDARFKDEWLANLAEVLGDRTPDYLIVQHMEAGSLCQYSEFCHCLSGCKDCCQYKNLWNDETVFWNRFLSQTGRGKRWRNIKHGKTFLYLCLCSDGTLAGSNGDL